MAAKSIAIYARVSTDSQTCDNQLMELRAVAARCGHEIVGEYVDAGISGSKGRSERQALDQMMRDANQRKFEMIVCWSIDRLGRSLQHLVELLNDCQSMRIDLMFLQQGLDTSSHSGRMMFSVFGALAEYEKNLIRERVMAGQKRAKARGVRFGRPSTFNQSVATAVLELRERGMGIREISKNLRIGCGTVYRALGQTSLQTA